MTSNWGADAFGVFLLVLGVFLMLRFRKRRFDRTNAFGVEEFPSYWSKIGAKAKDAVQGLFSALLLCLGVLVLALNHVDSWGWIVLLPMLAFVIFLPLGSWTAKRR